MALIGELATLVTARTAPFETGMKRAAGEARSFGQQVRTFAAGALKSALIPALAAVTGALATAQQSFRAFGEVIKDQFEAIDRIAKLSDRTGFTTEDLVSLSQGASLAGAEFETFTKALEVFSRRIGEAKFGNTEALKSFEEIQLQFEQIEKASPIEALKLVADRIREETDETKRAAIANELFGRSGKELINFLSQGSQSFDELRKRADELGITFDRFSAAQVEAANDALNEMRTTIKGLANDFAVELAPSIKAAADSVTDLNATINRSDFGRGAVRGATEFLGSLWFGPTFGGRRAEATAQARGRFLDREIANVQARINQQEAARNPAAGDFIRGLFNSVSIGIGAISQGAAGGIGAGLRSLPALPIPAVAQPATIGLAGAAERGTSDALRIIETARQQGQDQQKRQTELLAQILQAIRESGAIEVVERIGAFVE